ncbi:NADP-dependent malic enzyme [Natroniella acetigena]|nr:NADP-dependent malic enzyme [Natroniella acetigena]MCK8827413.1 NADP-dependent malic enzyme [Natroniella acetigena]
MTLRKRALDLHYKNKGKIEVRSKIKLETGDDLSIAYTPGVAEPCKEISQDVSKAYDYTSKSNMVAVVTDGSAVLGLGNIGPTASLPVMEGKAVLFKELAGVDAVPICLNTQDSDEIIETVKRLEPSFGGVNLEDISSPRCIEIEERLKQEVDLPIFHDDQHGTAIVVLAGLINALKLVEKELEGIKVVINGAGSAGIAIAKLLLSVGVKEIIMCDLFGILHPKVTEMNSIQAQMAEITNKSDLEGDLATALQGADALIGVSAPDVVSQEMVASMAADPVVFALANPIPEINPDQAKEAGAAIVGTGRSDYPNQINNVLAFPGIFRGALDVRATEINQQMKVAAAYAIANLIPENKLKDDYIIPDSLDKSVVVGVADAVAKVAIESGVAKVKVDK